MAKEEGMMTDTTQQRRFARAPIDLYVNKIVGDEPHLMRTRDISAGGVYVYKLLEPDLGDCEHVGLEMKLPNTDDIIWAVGKVVRENDSDADGLAIRFVRIAESDRKLIEDYVASVTLS
jgi:c-di-GMP-binding flagellar brake protein YcgR